MVLALMMTAGAMRYARSSMLDVLSREFITTARSKGMPEWRINILHGFRVALTPVVVLIGFRLPLLIGGSTIIEQVYQWPWSLFWGVPIWTAYEAFSLWAFANGYFLGLEWNMHPIYLGLTFLFLPLFREVHFYFLHRLLHTPLLYNFSHYIHHKNVNPGPWSGIAMHWFEHILYFSGTLIHFIIPATLLLL